MERLSELPLCLILIKEIHEVLLTDVRGGERNRGEFRRWQNWIGPARCTLATASFVPPPAHEKEKAMGDLELFMHEEDLLSLLLKIGLIHAQFETIHPFLEKNVTKRTLAA